MSLVQYCLQESSEGVWEALDCSVCLGRREYLCFLFTSIRTSLQLRAVVPDVSRVILPCQYSTGLVLLV